MVRLDYDSILCVLTHERQAGAEARSGERRQRAGADRAALHLGRRGWGLGEVGGGWRRAHVSSVVLSRRAICDGGLRATSGPAQLRWGRGGGSGGGRHASELGGRVVGGRMAGGGGVAPGFRVAAG